MALLDLSAAFDTLDHPIQLKRLEITFGVRGTVLDWFVSYLSGRFQSVIVDGVVSASRLRRAPGFRVGTGLVYLVLPAFVRCDSVHYLKYANDTELSKSAPPDQFLSVQSCI